MDEPISGNKMINSKQISSLTIFRFVAAFYVFIFHCNIRFPAELPKWIMKIIANGAIGMTFFFILSGFVLAISSKNGIRRDYVLSRFKRIYPAYLFMGLLTLPFLSEYSTKECIVYISLFLTTSQSLFTESFYKWNFGGSWSVSTEVFFYLFFPLIYKSAKSKPLLFLFLSFVISSLIIPIADVIYKGNFMSLVYTGPMYRIPEFGCGVAMGCLYNKGVRIRKNNLLLLMLSIISIMFISSNHNKYYTENNYITVSATCLIIYLISQLKSHKNATTQILEYMGKISYSFYLMQIPVMIFVDIHLKKQFELPWWAAWILMFLITSLLASFCYHAIECRGMKLSLKKPEPSQQ